MLGVLSVLPRLPRRPAHDYRALAEPVVTAKPHRAVEPPLPPAIPATADATGIGHRRRRAGSSDPMDRIVREAAERHKVDPALVKAVISTESGLESASGFAARERRD